MNHEKDIAKRFVRQLSMHEIGAEGQHKLLTASVLVIGAGGLGCPALQYLAAAGVGKIGIVDFDKVEISNLHRQLLYDSDDLGKAKAEVAAEKLKRQFPHTDFRAFSRELDAQIALELFSDYQIIVDGTDQIHTRYLINDACRILNKPWVFAAVSGFELQYAIFNHFTGAADYRDIFPIPLNPMEQASCEIRGTIGVIPGIAGMLQATEVIKWILGMAENRNKFHTQNLISGSGYFMESEAGFEREVLTENEFKSRDYLKYILEYHYPKSEI